MAAQRARSESVLDGVFSSMCKAGLPLSICIHLQEKGLDFDGAVWTAKQTQSGFSVSFFWSHTCASVNKAKPKKRRRKNKITSKSDGCISPQPTVGGKGPSQLSSGVPTESATEYESTEDIVDLPACDNVTFEVNDGLPGVKFVKEDKEQWTLVKKRRKKKRCDQEAINDSGSEIDVARARQVYYDERCGIPGLYMRRGCTLASSSWTPIKTAPVASRTRSRLKKSNGTSSLT